MKIRKILLAVDTRLSDETAIALTEQVARRHGAAVHVVDTVPDVSWLVRMLSDGIEELQASTRQAVSQKLESIVSALAGAGIDAEHTVLEGDTAMAILALAPNHDLVIATAKGQTSKVAGPFGITARRLLRACETPLWLVPESSGPPTHIAACVDTASDDPLDQELNDKVFSVAASLAAVHDAKLTLVHAWELRDEALLANRFPQQTIDRYAANHLQWRRERLEAFLESRGPTAVDVSLELVRADPADGVPAVVRERGIDLTVLGTVGRSGMFGMILGNTAELILEGLDCGVLTVKPSSFHSS